MNPQSPCACGRELPEDSTACPACGAPRRSDAPPRTFPEPPPLPPAAKADSPQVPFWQGPPPQPYVWQVPPPGYTAPGYSPPDYVPFKPDPAGGVRRVVTVLFALLMISWAFGSLKTFFLNPGEPPPKTRRRIPAAPTTPPSQDPADIPREADAAIGGSASELPLDEADRKGIVELAEAWTAVNTGKMDIELIDCERMADECLRRGANPPDGARKALIAGFRRTLPDWRRKTIDSGFMTATVKHIRRLASDEALVHVRLLDRQGNRTTVRWWVCKSGDRWLVYDVEHIGRGLRISVLTAAGFDKRNPPAWFVAWAKLDQEVLAAEKTGDFSKVRAVLWEFPREALPAEVEMLVRSSRAGALLAAGKPQEALDSLDGVSVAEMPDLIQVRAVALNRLNRFDDALASARRHRELVGPDAETSAQAGFALIALGRNAEAEKELFEALDDNPANIDALCWLSDALPLERQREVGERFARIPKPTDHFDGVAEYLVRRKNRAALESIIARLGMLAPLDPRIDAYAAKAAALPPENPQPK